MDHVDMQRLSHRRNSRYVSRQIDLDSRRRRRAASAELAQRLRDAGAD